MKRHSFVTFWLLLGMIVNGLYSLMLFLGVFNNIFSHLFIIILGVICVLTSLTYLLMLNYKIIGFWIFCILNVINIIFTLFFGENIFYAFFKGLLPIIVLYFILKIEYNAVSMWDYLNNDINLPPEKINKKCKSCQLVYSKLNSSCPECGSSLYVLTDQIPKSLTENISENNWVCIKCNEINNINSSSCKSCGYYK
jgi:RNA polymerase subunit RPABC4/transcription elongation factor Spt4